jgi:hypothetical protein
VNDMKPYVARMQGPDALCGMFCFVVYFRLGSNYYRRDMDVSPAKTLDPAVSCSLRKGMIASRNVGWRQGLLRYC